MKLTEKSINEFIDLLASDVPAPGGGSVSALAGAIGAALTAMVAGLTIGREKYKEHEAVMEELIQDTTALKVSLVDCINRDTEAYNAVTAVFKMPKSTDEEKAERRDAMQQALKGATKVPMDMMYYIHSALELTKKAIGKSNANAASDLGVSALNLKAGMQGAWLNVLINLSGITDMAFVDEYKNRGEDILKKSLPLADEIYSEILNSLK